MASKPIKVFSELELGEVKILEDDIQIEGYSVLTTEDLEDFGGASGGPGNPFVYQHDNTITSSFTLTQGKNGISAGPLSIADGVTVTVPDGSTWSIV